MVREILFSVYLRGLTILSPVMLVATVKSSAIWDQCMSLTKPLCLDLVAQPACLVIIPTLHHVSAVGVRVNSANSVIADGSGKPLARRKRRK
jgi:hypothetical protein